MRRFDNMRGLFHQTESGAFVANNAIVVGDVRLGKNSSVWFGCVIRGDDEPIEIGENSNIQDLSCLHVDYGCPLLIGPNVTVGHKAMLHGCTVEEGALIGIGAILLNNCHIGAGAIVAAGAVVGEGVRVPPRSLVMGVPAKVKKEVSEEQAARAKLGAKHYVECAQLFL
ncbi:MAG: gamma carbonic anhydrase family protein [Planctomycetota bacterium]|nr:MAG: gamma carbonic anhydrase family protein [Planctomycetota bacterium]